ncbi:glycosyl transferase [Pandoraea terrae]|uniref:Glycosyl transferase n=1 Tax=Pandoraea terrae TaxID=1537710 RepID=A0A5E4TRA4_9BURK|nr:glycosyltransferase [Pandoraea terrae]VVD90486.1 glycosyl transferase [Pandoraea terrae]
MFSILIPTWNNLPFLKLCLDSVRRHSAFEHEILVHVNDGSDGTLDWVREQGLRHTHSTGNVGVCLALNQLAPLATRDWLLFLNDDMFCTPGWDTGLLAAHASLNTPLCYLSSVMIEPTPSPSTQVIHHDFGATPDTFDEAGLLAFAKSLQRPDVNGVPTQPTLVRRDLWHLVGGYSIEFGPGMSSDDDFLMKLWLVGCRAFRTVGESVVYHFGCRSTGRVNKNRGSREFLMKWGMTQTEFKRDYLVPAGRGEAASLPNVPRPSTASRLKRAVHGRAAYPLADLERWDDDIGRHLVLAGD